MEMFTIIIIAIIIIVVLLTMRLVVYQIEMKIYHHMIISNKHHVKPRRTAETGTEVRIVTRTVSAALIVTSTQTAHEVQAEVHQLQTALAYSLHAGQALRARCGHISASLSQQL